MFEAYNFEQDTRNLRAAFIAANIMNMWMAKGKSVTPLDLLGKKPAGLSQTEIEDTRALLRERFKLDR